METQALRLRYPFTLSPLYRSLSTKQPTSISFKLEATNSNNSKASFNEASFEAERLTLDAEARRAMAVEEENSSMRDDPKAWKWIIRKRIWDLMEGNNFAQNPRPVHHRIPNFVGASLAAEKVNPILHTLILIFKCLDIYLVYVWFCGDKNWFC